MSFRDEINSVLKTPMRVDEEKKQESIKRGKILAKGDYESLKKCILQRAKQGKYIQKEGKKILIAEFVSPNLKEMLNYIPLSSERYDRQKIEWGCEISISDCIEFVAYKTELEQLALKDDIAVNVMCVVEGEIDGVIARHRFSLTETTRKRITKSRLKPPYSPYTYGIVPHVHPLLEASLVV